MGRRLAWSRHRFFASGAVSSGEALSFFEQPMARVRRLVEHRELRAAPWPSPLPHRASKKIGVGRHCKAGVVLRGEALPEVAIGRYDRPDPGEPQLLWQAVLQRAEYPLHASARLRRIGWDVGDAEAAKVRGRLG